MTELSRQELERLRAAATGPDVSGDEAMVVMRDVTYNVPVEQSALPYTPAMLRYRGAIERERADQPAGFIPDVPDL